jgi:hypothetical protein
MTDSSVISVKCAGEFVPSRCSDPAVADCGEKFDNDRGNLLRANLNGGCWDDTEVGNGQVRIATYRCRIPDEVARLGWCSRFCHLEVMLVV